MSDVFENVSVKFKNSPSALVLFLASVLMLVIGVNHLLEDVYSSYLGLISIENHYRLQVQIWEGTYWTMSASLQIATIVFFYIYLANTNKGWAWMVAFGAQTADFLADLWYRSNGAMFRDWDVTVVGAVITFVFFTVGSEVFVTFGGGLVLKLAAPALHSWKYAKTQVNKVKAQFEKGNSPKVYQEETRETSKEFNRKPEFRFKTHKKEGKGEISPDFMRKIRDEKLHRVNSEDES